MEVRTLAILVGSILLVGIVLNNTRPAYAETFSCTTTPLSGSEQVPPVETEGTGSATTLTFDSDTNELSWEIEFSGLSGNATAAHFHGPAQSGANAGVQVDIGEVSGLSSPMVGSAELTEEQASYLLDGELYINIHTEENPDGEIRGQVTSCDESETEMPPTTTNGGGEEQANGGDGEWQNATLMYGDEEFEIQYMIVNGTLNSLTGDAEDRIITAEITTSGQDDEGNDGQLTIQLPREMIDSVASDGQDLDFIVFVDEIIEYAEDDFGEDVRTLTIPFLQDSELIDIVSASPVPIEEGEWQTATLAIEENEYDIQYRISNGTLDNLAVDQENTVITAMVTAESDGNLTIRFPRDVADSKDGENDSPFVVTINGEGVEATDDNGAVIRTLSVNFSEGSHRIDFVGTYLAPEFGTIATIVLGITIVGIIVATARYNRFSFPSKM